MVGRVLQSVVGALGLLMGTLVVTGVAAAAGPAVIGEGSSFPLIAIEQWRADVAVPPLSLQINYNGTSSGQGRDEFKAGRVDFAVTDLPYPPGQSPTFEFASVPLSAGGIGFMFNLTDTAGRRVRDLRLTPVTACKLLTGQITSWTHPEIVADNPTFIAGYLRTTAVKAILRSGAAGTSYVMGQYCQALAPAVWERFALEGPGFQGGALWSNHPGPPLSQWPAPPGGANAGGSDQNANTVVSDTTGAGGFTAVEVGFALERNFPVASVRNDAGVFVQPTTAAVNKALSYAGGAVGGMPTLRFNSGDQDAYNPSAYSYALVRTGVNGMTPDKGSVLAQFLNYAVTRGQLKAEGLGYVPLPQSLIDGALDGIATVNGAPPRPQFTYPLDEENPPAPDPGVTIILGGSSLIAPLVRAWDAQLAASPSSVQIDYFPRNAPAARRALLDGAVDAALSAVPFSADDHTRIAALTAAGQQPEFVTIPISASALLFAELTPKNALHPPDSLTPTFDVPPGPAAGYTTAQALRFYMERPTLYDPEYAALHGYQVYDPGPGGEEPPRPNDVLPSDFAQLEISARVGPSAMGWMMERMMKERAPELWQRYRARIGRPTDSLSEDIVIPYSFNGSEPARWNTMSYERNLEEILAFATTGARPCCFFAGLPPWAMQQYRFRALDLLGLNRADQANLDRWELRPLRIDGVLPTPETIAAALAGGDGLSSTAATLPDMGGGYPASFVNKMIVRTDTLTPERVNSMVELIVFLVTTGQDQAPPLGDSRLPRFHVLGALDAANQLVSKACPQQQIVPGVTVELPPGAGTQGATVVMWGCRVAAMPPDPIIPESPWVLAIPLSAAASLAAVAAFRSKRGRASSAR